MHLSQLDFSSRIAINSNRQKLSVGCHVNSHFDCLRLHRQIRAICMTTVGGCSACLSDYRLRSCSIVDLELLTEIEDQILASHCLPS